MKSLIGASLLFIGFSHQAFACQLPTNGDADSPVTICNKLANKISHDVFKQYPVNFNNEFDEPMFYSSISAACSISGVYSAHGVPMFNALEWVTDSTYLDLVKYSHHKIPDNILLGAIKNAVIFGYTHAKDPS
ncbi:TPA: hypothetical protein M4731_004638 [Salmonella enterica]|nr:hypothetical protein [Salmonella enterica]MCH5739626.1 hypothetical protein [Salmonella enterica]MCH5744720.1 hypothetical protein [Salmonella enterica]MCH5749679.1 hypothetical protein [Salmonella enterica]MCH5757171.1 hypothetical protein [Salmonella enterica]